MIEENPDLPLPFMQEILVGREQIKCGQGTPYVFGEGEWPQTPTSFSHLFFAKQKKKLHEQAIRDLDTAVLSIHNDPSVPRAPFFSLQKNLKVFPPLADKNRM
jgi:hypothetical protein